MMSFSALAWCARSASRSMPLLFAMPFTAFFSPGKVSGRLFGIAAPSARGIWPAEAEGCRWAGDMNTDPVGGLCALKGFSFCRIPAAAADLPAEPGVLFLDGIVPWAFPDWPCRLSAGMALFLAYFRPAASRIRRGARQTGWYSHALSRYCRNERRRKMKIRNPELLTPSIAAGAEPRRRGGRRVDRVARRPKMAALAALPGLGTGVDAGIAVDVGAGSCAADSRPAHGVMGISRAAGWHPWVASHFPPPAFPFPVLEALFIMVRAAIIIAIMPRPCPSGSPVMAGFRPILEIRLSAFRATRQCLPPGGTTVGRGYRGHGRQGRTG